MNVIRLWALFTGRLYPPGEIPGTHFCYRLNRLQGHGVAGRIKSMKNLNVPIGNRTRFRLAAQCFNKLRHRVLPIPKASRLHKKKINRPLSWYVKKRKILRTLPLNGFSIQFVGQDTRISSKRLDRNFIYKDIPLLLKHTTSVAFVLPTVPHIRPFNFTSACMFHQRRLFSP